jgi:membrane protease YdiL (CAAX protease family)
MNTPAQQAVFAIAATVISSFIYFLLLDVIKADKKEKTGSRLINLFLLRKIGGMLVLGIIPAIIAVFFFNLTPDKTGLAPGQLSSIWPWIAGACAVIITLNVFNAKNPGIRAIYPELRLVEWKTGHLAIAIGGWIIYLAAYEYLFRGLLLFTCLEAWGMWPAVVINLALYAALHLPKGMKEAIAAIPFGALICYLTIKSGSILPAIFIHSLQAVSVEMFCIYRNPEMKFHLSKRNQP